MFTGRSGTYAVDSFVFHSETKRTDLRCSKNYFRFVTNVMLCSTSFENESNSPNLCQLAEVQAKKIGTSIDYVTVFTDRWYGWYPDGDGDFLDPNRLPRNHNSLSSQPGLRNDQVSTNRSRCYIKHYLSR